MTVPELINNQLLHIIFPMCLSLGVDFAGGLKLNNQPDSVSSQEDDSDNNDDELAPLDITED